MERGLTLLLWCGCAAVAGAVVADKYGHAAAGASTVALLALGAVLFGLFIWRELRTR
jgi:uncharacterized membrane protein YccC